MFGLTTILLNCLLTLKSAVNGWRVVQLTVKRKEQETIQNKVEYTL